MTYTLRIPYPPDKKARAKWNRDYSMNAYYSGKHWTQRKKDADLWHMLTVSALNRIGNYQMLTEASVTFYWSDGLDIDNHSVMGKMIVDALKGRMLADDNKKHLREVCHRFGEDKENIVIEITGKELTNV